MVDVLPPGFKFTDEQTPAAPPVQGESGLPAGYKFVDAPAASDRGEDLPHGTTLAPAPAEAPRERPTILPLPLRNPQTGEREWVNSSLGKSLVDAIMLPGRAAKGDAVSMHDVINAAGFMAGGVAPRKTLGVLSAETGRAVPKPLARALRSDAIAPEAVAGKLNDLGPEAVVADLGPNLQKQTAAVAGEPGAGQKMVVDTLTERKAGAPARLRTELDTTLGPATTPSEMEAGVKAGHKALSPEYDAVLAKASSVDTAALATKLDEIIPTLRGDAQTAAASVRKMLNKVGDEPATDAASIIAAEMDPTKRRDLVRRHLAGEVLSTATPLETDPRVLKAARDAIGGLLDTTKDGNVRRVLTQAKQDVDAVLASAAPGIKELDAKHGSLEQANKNFKTGQTVLGNGMETPRPSELRTQMAAANTPIGTEMGPTIQARALTQGARDKIEQVVGTNLNDRAALNALVKGEGDWNYDRLSTLFGKDRTDRIYKILGNERTMAETENLATAGSKTGAVTAAREEVSPTRQPGVTASLLNAQIGTAAHRLNRKVLGNVYDYNQAQQNEELAKALMSKGPLKSGVKGARPAPYGLIDTIMRGKEDR